MSLLHHLFDTFRVTAEEEGGTRGLVSLGEAWRGSGLGIHLPNALESR